MRRTFFVILFSYAFANAFGQGQGDYQSDQGGNWSTATTWEVFFNGAWRDLETVAAGPYRNVIPSSISGGFITVRHAVLVNVNTTANQLIVSATGTLTVRLGRSLIIQDDGINTPLEIAAGGNLVNNGTLDLQTQMISVPIQIFGTLSSAGAILASNPSLLIFHPASTYVHLNASGGNIPRATWDVSSTCRIAGLTKSKPGAPGNLSQAFGNFEWNTPNLGASTTFHLAGALQNVLGNLTFVNTGTNTTVRLGSAGGGGLNLTVGGNFTILGGFYILAQNLASTSTITIGGNLVMSGGTLRMGAANSTAVNLLLNGNFVKTGGTFLRGTGAGIGTIRFDGTVQTYSNNLNITDAVHFSVQSGSTLDLGTSFLTGTGSFTLLAGGTVNAGSTDAGGAIQLGTAGGNIRVSGARTYQTGSNIFYNGLAAQFMGTGHPAAPHTTISNAVGVTLLSNVAFNGNLTLNGPFNPQSFTVTLGGGSKTISGTNSVTFYDLVINQTAASNVALTTNADIVNSMDINSLTTFVAGNQQLRLLSTPTRTANVMELAPGASITGSVIVQRHLPMAVVRKQYFHLASPVQNSTLGDWDAEIPMEKAFRYDEPTRTYVQIPLNSTTPSGQGFTVLVDGPNVTTTMDSRGTLGQGIVPIALTSQSPVVDGPDGWNLIGNPYPSAIDWDNVALPPGVYNAVYVWDNFGNSGQGSEPGKIVSYVDDVGTPSGYGGVISQGQGFWVKATANATLTFTEGAKSTVTNSSMYRQGDIPNVLRIVISGTQGKDETVVRLRDGATDEFDGQFDAYKYLANEFNISTLTKDNVKAVINAFGTSSCDKIVPVVMEGVQPGTYTLDFVGIDSFEPSVTLSLLDEVEKKKIDIRKQAFYTFTVADDNLASIAKRFQLSMAGNSDVSSINTSIVAKGEPFCAETNATHIVLETSEADVTYSVQWNGTSISEPKTGTGSSLELDVNTTSLPMGESIVTIVANAGLCSMGMLDTKPTITKLKLSEITSVQDGSVCGEGPVTLKVSGVDQGGRYHWYESSDDMVAIASQEGSEFITPSLVKSKTYYVAPVNALGCEGARVAVKATVSHSEGEQVTLTQQGSTLISSSEEGNHWYLNGLLLEGETSNTLEPLEAGLYSVTIEKGACVSTASLEIADLDGVDDVIRVFPNPTKDKVIVRVRTVNNNATATVVNNQGLEISSKKLVGENEIKEAEFDLVPHASGIYHVRVLDGQKNVTKKIAKIK